MELENEPFENSKALVKDLFHQLLKREDLIPKHWDKPPEYLIGLAVWDIFSNNHEVISSKHKIHHIGSWRGSGDTISDIINEHFREERTYGYLDFYMGSSFQTANELNLEKIYVAIFKLLKSYGCDWHYAHPRIYLIDFGQKSEEDNPKQANLFYNPNEAIEKELERKKKTDELKELQDKLDEDFDKRVAEAQKEPLPQIIKAFKGVYGYLPKGF